MELKFQPSCYKTENLNGKTEYKKTQSSEEETFYA